jgi:hypothetical protein
MDVRWCAKREGSWTFAHVDICMCVWAWDGAHGMVWVGTGRVSWTDEDVRFFEGGEYHTQPNLDGP